MSLKSQLFLQWIVLRVEGSIRECMLIGKLSPLGLMSSTESSGRDRRFRTCIGASFVAIRVNHVEKDAFSRNVSRCTKAYEGFAVRGPGHFLGPGLFGKPQQKSSRPIGSSEVTRW
jgi:hypothetical protein